MKSKGALHSSNPRSGDCSRLPLLRSRPSRPQSVSRPPETRSAPPGQPRRALPAGRRTRTSLPRNSDAGMAYALPCSLIRCMRAASFSWTQLRPFSATGLPGAALCPAASWRPGASLDSVEVTQSPHSPRRSPYPCADPPGVTSCCCHSLRVPVSPRSHHAGTLAPSEPRWTLLITSHLIPHTMYYIPHTHVRHANRDTNKKNL